MNKESILGLPEILGAILSNTVGSNATALKADAFGFIEKNTGVNLEGEDHNLEIVENNANTVHVALPYYDFVPDGKASAIEDSEALGVSGGLRDTDTEILREIKMELLGHASDLYYDSDTSLSRQFLAEFKDAVLDEMAPAYALAQERHVSAKVRAKQGK